MRVWRAEEGGHYFCHGLTLGGKEAPGGPISPYSGVPVETVLEEHYELIPEGQARAGDILVWKGVSPETTPHSAVLAAPSIAPGQGYLDYSTRLQTKNGLTPEASMSLGELIEIYGESYNVYRRRHPAGARP